MLAPIEQILIKRRSINRRSTQNTAPFGGTKLLIVYCSIWDWTKHLNYFAACLEWNEVFLVHGDNFFQFVL